MLEKYSFIPVFSCILGGLAWWSNHVSPNSVHHASAQSVEKIGVSDTSRRRDLIETLDRVVAYEHYYHSVYGKFTKSLSRAGYSVPKSLGVTYDIRISEASVDKLLVTAVSELEGRVVDLVSINQEFLVHANFPIPAPRVEYLKNHALKHLRLLRGAPEGRGIEEQGVYKGYFEYSVKENPKTGRVASAVGVVSPVNGIHLEVDSMTPASAEIEAETALLNEPGQEFEVIADDFASQTGQQQVSEKGDAETLEEEAYLAQRIFYGEIGRYAKSWSELSKIAHFKFAGKDKYGGEDHVPYGDSGRVQPARSQDRHLSSTPKGGLEIEAIQTEDEK